MGSTFSNIIIGAIVGVAILAVIIMAFLFQIPGVEKTKFDNVCDQYFTRLVANGDLTSAERSDLQNKLTNMNVKNISISVTSGNWGDDVTLSVTAAIELKQVYGDVQDYNTSYKNTSICLAGR